MILDTLAHAAQYEGLHPDFKKAFAFLRDSAAVVFAPGRVSLDGEKNERLYALLSDNQGKGLPGARLEAHRKYIDIQCCVSGDEVIGWKAAEECSELVSAYDPAKDIEFYSDTPRFWAALAPGSFVILFPHDAHAPLAGEGAVRKIVIKVQV